MYPPLWADIVNSIRPKNILPLICKHVPSSSSVWQKCSLFVAGLSTLLLPVAFTIVGPNSELFWQNRFKFGKYTALSFWKYSLILGLSSFLIFWACVAVSGFVLHWKKWNMSACVSVSVSVWVCVCVGVCRCVWVCTYMYTSFFKQWAYIYCVRTFFGKVQI